MRVSLSLNVGSFGGGGGGERENEMRDLYSETLGAEGFYGGWL